MYDLYGLAYKKIKESTYVYLGYIVEIDSKFFLVNFLKNGVYNYTSINEKDLEKLKILHI